MLIKASNELSLDLDHGVMIGDQISATRAGKNAGVSHSIIVNSGHAVGNFAVREADEFACNLVSAARDIAGLQTARPINQITGSGNGREN